MQRYPHLLPDFHSRTRKKLAKKMKIGSILILGSNQKVRANADSFYPFRQNSDFLYLTGILEENCLLVMKKRANSHLDEYLLIPKVTERKVIWEGDQLTKQMAQEISGVQQVDWNENKSKLLRSLVGPKDIIMLPLSLSTLLSNLPSQKDLVYYIKRKFGGNKVQNALPLIHSLRVIKEEEEIALIEKALEVTWEGVQGLLPMIKAGKWEFELESALLGSFLDKRSRGFAFDPIVASGANSCILHYVQNKDQLKAGDPLLLDIGAEYGGYNADITRMIPVSTFTDRQEKVIDAVDEVVKDSIDSYKPGATIKQINKQVASLIEDKLLQLGLITKGQVQRQSADNPAHKKYYMHSASHFLGIDVHDVGDRNLKLQPGMVLTLEPGIYIREWNFGVRLEEDILITKDGCRVLSEAIPRRLR